MFADQIADAVRQASYPQLNDLNQRVWAAWGAGALTDEEAQGLAEALQARRLGVGSPKPRNSPAGNVVPYRGIRRNSIERRRRLAASGPMPPALACQFTIGELAVLRIVADECRQHGTCSAYIDAIAARSGTSRSVVKRALVRARALCLVSIEERRRRGQASLTNLVRVVSREWKSWIDRGPKKNHHGYQVKKEGFSRKEEGVQNASLIVPAHRGAPSPMQRSAPPCPIALQRPPRRLD